MEIKSNLIIIYQGLIDWKGIDSLFYHYKAIRGKS